MPQTKIQVYRAKNGTVPLKEWLVNLQKMDKRAFAKCVAMILRLEQLGHELRRPESAPLRDGIHELRTRVGTVNYRLLYSFNGKNTGLLLLGCTKEDKVPDELINLAVDWRNKATANPKVHIATFD